MVPQKAHFRLRHHRAHNDRVAPLLPRLIGKSFIEKKKRPIPVNLKRNIAQELTKACGSTYLYLGMGACSAVRVGHSGMTVTQLAENIYAAATLIAEQLPKKANMIQSVHIKSAESLALPVYNSLPEVDVLPELDTVKESLKDAPSAKKTKKTAASKTTAVKAKSKKVKSKTK